MSRFNDLQELVGDAINIWDEWINCGYVPGKPLKIDFDFYSANMKQSHKFCDWLMEESFDVDCKAVKTLFLFKGWRILASIEHIWTFDDFKIMISYLGTVAIEHETIMEGYGALIDKKTYN